MNGFITCAHCGKLHMVGSEGRMEFIDGRFYCEDCIDEVSFVCRYCGERHLKEHSVYVSSTQREGFWCEDCAQEHAQVCEECGELTDEDDMMYIESVQGYVCDDCRDRSYVQCERCGEWIREADAQQTDYSYDYYCEDCYNIITRSDNARVRGYHNAPPLEFIGDCLPTWNGLWRGIGIELEVDCHYGEGDIDEAVRRINDIAGEHLHFEHDGSLDNGFEIVTQPHTVSAFYDMPWSEILNICEEEGFSSHDIGTCGLHVHFSRACFGADEETQQDNIAKLMQFYELYWDDVLKVSRRTEDQANSWASRYATANKKRLKDYTKGDRYAGRYMAINLTNRDTVEIRLTRGTLNYDTFMACMDFMICAVENSCRIGWSDTTDDYEWLVNVKDETLQYLQDRGAFYESVSRIRTERYANAASL